MCYQLPFPYTIIISMQQRYWASDIKVDIPHSGKQLDQPTVCKSCSNQYIGLANTPHLHLNTPEKEDAQCKGTETQWSWIGHLAVLRGSVQTWLEFTTKRRHPAFSGVDMGQGPKITIVDMGALKGLGMVRGGVVAGIGGGTLEGVPIGGFYRRRHVSC